eukprot:gene12862-12989_t
MDRQSLDPASWQPFFAAGSHMAFVNINMSEAYSWTLAGNKQPHLQPFDAHESLQSVKADEDAVNQLPPSVQDRLAAAGRWARGAGGRLIRSSVQAALRTVERASNSAAALAPAHAGFESAKTAAGQADDGAMLGKLMAAAPGTVLFDC